MLDIKKKFEKLFLLVFTMDSRSSYPNRTMNDAIPWYVLALRYKIHFMEFLFVLLYLLFVKSTKSWVVEINLSVFITKLWGCF